MDLNTAEAESSSGPDYTAKFWKNSKRRVDAAGPNGRRCLIENISPHPVVYCHLIPRSLSDKRITALEFWWHMKPNTLNLDTRNNVFRCGATLQCLHENGWGLLPADQVIEQYHSNLYRRSDFPIIPDGIFEYTFIPLNSELMGESWLTFQINVPPAETPVAVTDFKIILYPFDELPVRKSHVHPKFAIYRLGRQLDSIYRSNREVFESLTTGRPSLSRILTIYNAWSQDVPSNPPSSFESDSSPDLDLNGRVYDDDCDIWTNCTPPRRLRPLKLKPSRSGRRLSRGNVYGLDALVGKFDWSRQNIRNWANSIDAELRFGGLEIVVEPA
ncbi:hypothetical protein ONZ45_g1810 [Pleurotus djamor]|nr:hypothetical protein ONZ45_g1810 [Pleurotus djamor]